MSKTQNVREQESVSPPQNASKAKKAASAVKTSGARATGKPAVASTPKQNSAVSEPTKTVGFDASATAQNLGSTQGQEPPHVENAKTQTSDAQLLNAVADADMSVLDSWVRLSKARDGYINDDVYSYSPLPEPRLIRPRQFRFLSDGSPNSVVLSLQLAFQHSVSMNRRELHLCPSQVFYDKSLYRVQPDLLVVDEGALPNRVEQLRLHAHLRQSMRIPIVICDPKSEFGRSLPPALHRPFPQTHDEVKHRLCEVFFGPRPIARLMLHFEEVISELPKEIFPMEFVDQLEYMHPLLYANALRFLRGCHNPRRILRWKVLDLLGDSMIGQRRFEICADLFPLGTFLDCLLEKPMGS